MQSEIDEILKCPACKSTNVTVIEEHMVMANTLEHYCYSVKANDNDATAVCLDCHWRGQRVDMTELRTG